MCNIDNGQGIARRDSHQTNPLMDMFTYGNTLVACHSALLGPIDAFLQLLSVSFDSHCSIMLPPHACLVVAVVATGSRRELW
jgi:hypothetical protein